LPETNEFLRRTLDLLQYVVPKYEREGKSYLTIAFGCTGGMHRSVVLAEHVAAELDATLASTISASTPPPPLDGAARPQIEVAVVHRDVGRREPSALTSTPPDFSRSGP
jgi:UPF0042 nucleotide-binding protein